MKLQSCKMSRVYLMSVLLVFCTQVSAADDMQDLLLEVQKKLDGQQQQENSRLIAFQKKQQGKVQLLALLQAEVNEETLQQQQLIAAYSQQQLKKAALEKQLQQRSSELNILFSLTKKQGLDFSNRINTSLSSGRYFNRNTALQFATQTSVPTLLDIKNLWFMLLQEMVANSGTQTFVAPIVNSQGASVEQAVYQFANFAAIGESGEYLSFNQSSNALQVLTGQPVSLTEQAQEYAAGVSNMLVVDPQKGELLLQSTLVPSLEERLHQGGIVGYIILSLGGLGLLVALWRLLYMLWVDFKISRQLRTSIATLNNPLGRVLLAAKGVRIAERAELLIDKAMLAEIPRLERCQSLIKLLAAVAPLLGLLGTVTGMIETFQSITLVGTSDPKLMAGGISQALITTVMGLCVAIPLLFCHSFLSNKSKLILQLIQQQSLLLLSDYVAQAAEGKKAAINKECLINDQISFEKCSVISGQENTGCSALA